MSKEKLVFAQPESVPERRRPSAGATAPAAGGDLKRSLRRLTSRRLWPVYAAGLATILWTGGIGLAAWRAGYLLSPGVLELPALAALIGGLAAPIAVIWLIALVYQRTDPLLERRIEMVQGMERALAPIEAAESRIGQIGEALQKQIGHIELAADIATQRIENLEQRFQEQLSDLFSATADADAKSTSMRDRLERQRQAIQTLSEDIEDKAAAIETRMTAVTADMAATISRAHTESGAAADLLSRHSESAKASSESSAQTLREAGAALQRHQEALRAAAEKNRAEVESTFTSVMSRADALAERMTALETIARSLTSDLAGRVADMDGLAVRTTESATSFSEALGRQKTAMTDAAASASESARTTGATLAGQATQIEDIVRGIELRVDETVTAALGRIEALDSRVEAGARTLKERADEGAANIQRVSDAFGDHTGMIARVANEAAEAVKSAQSALDERTAGLGQMLSEAKQRLADAEDLIARQQEALARSTQQAAGVIEDAGSRLKSRSEEIGQVAGEAARRVNQGGEVLTARLVQLRESGEAADQKLAGIGARLEEESNKAISKIRLTTDVLDIAATAFSEERTKFESDMTNIVHRLETGVTSLHGETARLTSEGEAAASRLANLSSDVARSAETTRSSVEGAMKDLQERFGQTLDLALADLRLATDRAASHAGATAERVADQADRIVGRAELFVARADELQRKLSESLKDDFLKSSSLLVDALSAGAFDIGRVLEADIPENVWKKYLAGDRKIFARRIVSLGSRKMRKDVAERFASDAEFRNHVLKFMRDFESLMERVMATPGGNAISVTLISSELGKLYVFLAQATKKL